MSKETPQEIIIQSLTKRVTELKAENARLERECDRIEEHIKKMLEGSEHLDDAKMYAQEYLNIKTQDNE